MKAFRTKLRNWFIASVASVTETKNKDEISMSQRQGIIKSIEKKIETKDASKCITDSFLY